MKEIKVVRKVDCGIYYTEEEHTALVDDDRYDALIKFRWWAILAHTRKYYFCTRVPGSRETVPMGYFIVGKPINRTMDVDHKDGNTYNYQEYNLEVVTRRQNSQNRHVEEGKLPGVFWSYYNNNLNPWLSQISIGGKSKYLGFFRTKTMAFFRYKEELEKMGEFIQPYVLEKCYKIIDAEMAHI
jgi:hypothetical protein